MKDFTERLLAFLGFRFIRFFKLRYTKGKFIYLKGPLIKQKHLMAVSYNLLGTTRSPHKNWQFPHFDDLFIEYWPEWRGTGASYNLDWKK